jgi:hypothetical protein
MAAQNHFAPQKTPFLRLGTQILMKEILSQSFALFILSFSCIKIASRLIWFYTERAALSPEQSNVRYRDMNRLLLVAVLLGPVVTGSA